MELADLCQSAYGARGHGGDLVGVFWAAKAGEYGDVMGGLGGEYGDVMGGSAGESCGL